MRALITCAVWGFLLCQLNAQRFFDDDPLWREPPPINVDAAKERKLINIVDFYKNTFKVKGERHRPDHIYPSLGINSLGEVPDSAWYTNRHATRRMSREELMRGPGNQTPPAMDKPWEITSAKNEGVTPGFHVKDSKGHRYLIKFDPLTNPEMASAADVIGSKFFYALGYNTPENHIVYFKRENLRPGADVKFRDTGGRERQLEDADIDDLLRLVPKDDSGQYRALASLYLPGKPLGGFKYYGRRQDDPNELALHEHLRVLRGLYVFCAWLNHTDAKSLNSLDMLVKENGLQFVRHNLIDFGASLGSDSLAAKDPRLGHLFFIEFKPAAAELLTLGAYVPRWQTAHFPHLRTVGNFESEVFDPDNWKTNYPNAAFANRLPEDEYWAAKKVMAFTDDDIRALVSTGRYSDSVAEQWVADTLIRRRDKIARTFYAKMLPLDRFTIAGDRLQFSDLGTDQGFTPARNHAIQWARFDNARNQLEALRGRTGVQLPEEMKRAADRSYWAAIITNDAPDRRVTVYLRRQAGGWKVVGVDRVAPYRRQAS